MSLGKGLFTLSQLFWLVRTAGLFKENETGALSARSVPVGGPKGLEDGPVGAPCDCNYKVGESDGKDVLSELGMF